MSKLSIGLIGAGAVGCFYAAHFSRLGAEVTILTRTPDDYGPHITIASVTDPIQFTPRAVHHYSDHCGPFDVVILATKVLPNIDPVSLIQPYISTKSLIVVIQNGLFIEDELLQTFSNCVIRGLAFVCAHRTSKTEISHLDYGSITMGPLNCDLVAINSHPFFVLSQKLSINVTLTSSIQQTIWEKLVWNAAFNSLSVYYGGKTTDELLSTDRSVKMLINIMKEVQSGARFAGVNIPDDFIDQKLDQTRQMVSYKTSMCLDYEAKRPLEINAILGHFISFCHRHDCPTPFSQIVYDQLKTR